MKRKIQDEEMDAILLMVKESATRLNVHDVDFLEEYQETVRESKTVFPKEVKSDEFSSPFVVTDVLLGFGLLFLGQTAASLFEWICHRSLDKGSKTLFDWLSIQKPVELVEACA